MEHLSGLWHCEKSSLESPLVIFLIVRLVSKEKQGRLFFFFSWDETVMFQNFQPLKLYLHFRYCLDNRRALEKDMGFAELQTRLIRYETQTTCTRECCPVPSVLSPLPSPAVLSEPGSIPDGESLQRELRIEASKLKCRSKDRDPNKR